MNPRLTLLALALLVLAPLCTAAEPLPPRTAFELDGRKAFIIAALEPAKDRPWLWYAPTLPGLPGAGHQWYFERLLKAGISIAGIDLGEVRGSPASNAKFSAFHDEMIRRGFSPKPVLLGQSRGGLMMLAWAVRNPDKVTALTGIYPVCNLTSWPMKNSKAAVLADYALPEAELLANLTRFNPVDNLKGLLEKHVPIFIVHGDSDATVPLADNGEIVKRRYEAGGGSITLKVISGEGHKVSPSFFECQELVDFIIAKTAGGK